MKPLAIALAALTLSGGVTTGAAEDPAALHKRLLTLDTHLDTPLHFGREGWRFDARHSPADDISQVDLGRMREGALDGGFFVIYTDQGPLSAQGYADALAFARTRSDLIDRTIAAYPKQIAPALTAADARRLDGEGKLFAFKSIENSYPLGEDLSLLAEFYAKGVRLAGPVHGKNNQFADSATDAPRWNGLSPLGRLWVAEMNRLGMVIDASHASDAAFDQMLELSKYPILLSHSSLRSAYDHPRNLDEDRLRKLAVKGGAMCISTIYLSEMNLTAERAELFGRYEQIGTLSPADQADLTRRWNALNTREKMWNADFEKVMAMLLRAIEVAGIDHVCVGADWDGGGGVDGIEDITALPKITARLKAAGYGDAEIEKIWSGNVLRILGRQKG
ncbi:dipeptidase [Sphingomonas sp. M1-B02]|uniref:dipeptidase n=1 Tax=Sphingomonas sp. M1-B02 TaxID=3114300 RepID=UPI00223EB607|nr:membrane dipeptidase [Sphingomonas sp. S6-11]UZK65377.1 dipeptidase [Sphingomonas sp. S6-11]